MATNWWIFNAPHSFIYFTGLAHFGLEKGIYWGILFIIIALGLSPIVFSHNYRMNHSIFISLGIILTITIPFVIVGVLFIISHFKKKKSINKK